MTDGRLLAWTFSSATIRGISPVLVIPYRKPDFGHQMTGLLGRTAVISGWGVCIPKLPNGRQTRSRRFSLARLAMEERSNVERRRLMAVAGGRARSVHARGW